MFKFLKQVGDYAKVKPLRELVYLPKGVIDPHDMPSNTRRAGLFPKEILEQQEVRASDPNLQ